MLEALKSGQTLEFTLLATLESPVYNPVFVIHKWSSKKLLMKVDGEQVNGGKDFRYSTEYDVDGMPALVIWIRYESESPINISFEQLSSSNN
jgi:hypothetical protein